MKRGKKRLSKLDMAFGIALKEAEKSGKGSLAKVKKHLAKISAQK